MEPKKHLNKLKINGELIGIVLVIIAFLLFYFLHLTNKKNISSNGVYVLGIVYDSSFGNETGWVYDFKYRYKGNTYMSGFTGPKPVNYDSDRLIFLRISSTNPLLWELEKKNRVPSCLNWNNAPDSGWSVCCPSCK